MALDNYTDLQTAIGNWLNRADLTSAIPDFITLAEVQMARRFQRARHDGEFLPRDMLVKNAAFAITANTEYVNVPSDFLGTMSFFIDPQTLTDGSTGGARQLDYVGPENLEYLKQKRGPLASTALPAVYSIAGSQFQFLPIPDQNYTGTLFYWQAIPALASNSTNWILAKHPDAYLYGALLQAAPYLVDDARVQIWGTLFTTVLDDIIKSDPLPSDRSWLRMESGLVFRPNSTNTFNISTGDFSYGP